MDHAQLTALVWAGIHGLASLSIQGALRAVPANDLVDLWGRDVLALGSTAERSEQEAP